MPWRLESSPDGWYVVNSQTGERVNKKPYPTKQPAKRYLSALYANEPHPTKKGHNGVMISLPIPQYLAIGLSSLAQLRLGPNSEMVLDSDIILVTPEEMHITLMYLGKIEDFTPDDELALAEAVSGFAIEWFDKMSGEPLEVEIQGTGRFNSAEEGMSALFFIPSGIDLGEFRESLVSYLRDRGIESPSNHGFVPHITFAYVPDIAPTPTILFPNIPLEFESVSFCFGDSYSEYPISRVDVEEKTVHEESGLIIYKTKDGRSRWVAYSSNGFEDRDEECIETKALEEDCLRADKEAKLVGTIAYGPLRFWHSGEVLFTREKDWSSSYAGPGIDLGMCDFNAVVNGILIESGTFFDERYAEILGPVTKGLRVSIGFTKPPDEPDHEKVYHHIRRYERSLVPLGYALPSNRFTSFAVKQGMELTHG